MRMLVKCYDEKMAKLPGDSFYRDLHMQLANKKKKKKGRQWCHKES